MHFEQLYASNSQDSYLDISLPEIIIVIRFKNIIKFSLKNPN